MDKRSRQTLLKLFDELVRSTEKGSRSKKTNDPSTLLFRIYHMNRNNQSRIFLDSAIWVAPRQASILMDEGLAQRVQSDGVEKFALTFKGLAIAIKTISGSSLEAQFIEFLRLSDGKSETGKQAELQWDEKLASLALVLVGSTSNQSAVRIDNAANKSVWQEVFDRILVCLKKYQIIREDVKFPSTSRGETPASAIMSRLNQLPGKTRFYYSILPGGSGYYFDIEKNGRLEYDKLQYIFGLIFQPYLSGIDYRALNVELTDLSLTYSPRFLDRVMSTSVSLEMLRRLKSFLDNEVWRLPIAS